MRTANVLQWFKRITGPTLEPVCPSWLSEQLRLSDAGEAAGLVTPARQKVEDDSRRALLTQTWELKQACWSNPIRLHFPPVQSVSKVEYRDQAGDLQTLDPTLYSVDLDSTPGYIWREHGVSWPTLWSVQPSVVVTMVCGYPDVDTLDAELPNARWAIRDAAGLMLPGEDCRYETSYSRLIYMLQWGDYP